MRFRRPIPGGRGTHTWEHDPGRRAMNGGLGLCNTASGKRMICALGGIGCDVDHITIAQGSLGTPASAPAPTAFALISYVLRSRDPDGTFLSTAWETAFLPRVGEDVLLPDGSRHWQGMVVTEIEHGPSVTSVWVGGSDGWDPGSVTALFENARRYRDAPDLRPPPRPPIARAP